MNLRARCLPKSINPVLTSTEPARQDRILLTIKNSEALYFDELFGGKTPVEKVLETENMLAYHHTRPFWPVHIV
ncbi:hypothetical protein BH24ACI3_BH24ACI3_13070 [soil metagenome]